MKKLMYVLFALGLLVSAPVVVAEVEGDNGELSCRCGDGLYNEDSDVTDNEEVTGDEVGNEEVTGDESGNEEVTGDESGSEDPDLDKE